MSPRGSLHILKKSKYIALARNRTPILWPQACPKADYAVSAVTVCRGEAN